MINPKDQSLTTRQKDLSDRAERYSLLILVGLLIEIGASLHFLGWSWRSLWMIMLPNALIWTGVFGELHFGRLARAVTDELGEIAQAQIRAANARVTKAEAKLTDRELTRAQGKAFSSRLLPYAHRSDGVQQLVGLYHASDDTEALKLALQLQGVFLEGGWVVSLAPERRFAGIRFGGLRVIATQNPRSLEAASQVLEAFTEAGLDATLNTERLPLGDNQMLNTGAPGAGTAPNPVYDGRVVVLVGEHP